MTIVLVLVIGKEGAFRTQTLRVRAMGCGMCLDMILSRILQVMGLAFGVEVEESHFLGQYR